MQQNVDESLILNSFLKVPDERVFSYQNSIVFWVSQDSDYALLILKHSFAHKNP